MRLQSFIFSNKILPRAARHTTFWLSRMLFLTSSNSIYSYDPVKGYFSNFFLSLKFIPIVVLIFEVGFFYVIIYFFVPKYFLRKKYISFIISFFITALGTMLIGFPYHYWLEGLESASVENVCLSIWYHVRNFLILGGPPTCIVFLSIKMFKTWYLKEEEKQTLIIANANAELQLLKAQIHPHFLFNTLNNIYSFTLNKSSEAATLVSKLSDTMSYMITDCNAELIPLQKELKIIRDYISLEEVRYGNQLDISLIIEGNYQNKMITPLLMIPFVENSFKHGTSKMLREPWIKLFIQTDENVLHFSLVNSKPVEETIAQKKGIGLKNVKQRLELLYPQRHLLLIESTPNTFTVNMQVPIFKIEENIIA